MIAASIAATSIAIVVGAVWMLVRKALIVRVVGHSMDPSLRDGDRLLAWRRQCRVGDIVVFRSPVVGMTQLIKRVAAMADDLVPADLSEVIAGRQVPAGHVVVRGDNPRSLDSRRIGLVPVDLVEAVVVLRLDRRPQREPA